MISLSENVVLISRSYCPRNSIVMPKIRFSSKISCTFAAFSGEAILQTIFVPFAASIWLWARVARPEAMTYRRLVSTNDLMNSTTREPLGRRPQRPLRRQPRPRSPPKTSRRLRRRSPPARRRSCASPRRPRQRSTFHPGRVARPDQTPSLLFFKPSGSSSATSTGTGPLPVVTSNTFAAGSATGASPSFTRASLRVRIPAPT